MTLCILSGQFIMLHNIDRLITEINPLTLILIDDRAFYFD